MLRLIISLVYISKFKIFIMKKIKLLILALVIGTTTLIASNIDTNNNSKKEIKYQIVNLESHSNFSINTEKNVTLKFSVNSNAEIVVLSLDSKNANLLNYVRQNLNGQKLTSSADTHSFETKSPVEIKFSINSNSEIVVLSINTKNRDILNYVRENLNGKKI